MTPLKTTLLALGLLTSLVAVSAQSGEKNHEHRSERGEHRMAKEGSTRPSHHRGNKQDYTNMTDEQRQAHKEQRMAMNEARQANMTDEQRQAYKEQRMSKKGSRPSHHRGNKQDYANMTDAQRQAHQEQRLAMRETRHAEMTDEQRQAHIEQRMTNKGSDGRRSPGHAHQS